MINFVKYKDDIDYYKSIAQKAADHLNIEEDLDALIFNYTSVYISSDLNKQNNLFLNASKDEINRIRIFANFYETGSKKQSKKIIYTLNKKIMKNQEEKDFRLILYNITLFKDAIKICKNLVDTEMTIVSVSNFEEKIEEIINE